MIKSVLGAIIGCRDFEPFDLLEVFKKAWFLFYTFLGMCYQFKSLFRGLVN